MTGEEFDDAYSADDEAELERARRRARRAVLRRERGEPGDPAETDDNTAVGPVHAEPDESSAAPQPVAARGNAPDEADGPAGEVSEPEAADRRTAGGGGLPPRRTRRFSRGPSGGQLWLRRGLGIGALVLVALIAYIGVTALADSLGGGGQTQELGDTGEDAAKASGKTVDLVVPEGLDRSQIAAEVKSAGIKGDYERASRSVSKREFDLADLGAGKAESLEGFLFPATYELPRKQANADELVAQQLGAFRDYFGQVDMKYADSKNLTPYDIVIIASMIEREVSVAKERKLVAAVIYNRLSQGMPLGIDATTRFAVGNFDQPLTESELAVDSPYNTRTNSGLPPGPIGNPGLASLKAAANPAKVDFLYYVVEPGTCDRHVFTASQAEFDEAAAEYQAALEEQGGSPTTC